MKRYVFIASVLCNVVFVALVIRHFVLFPKKPVNPPLIYFANGEKVLATLPKSPSDILFFGDSQFATFRVEELFNSLRVKNRGIYYDSSRGIAGRAINIAGGKPATVFILCGITDLETGVALDTTVRNIKTAITIIKSNSPGTSIYILSVLPTALQFGDEPHSIESDRLKLNHGIQTLCKVEHVSFINLDPVFLQNGGLKEVYDVGDKIHLSGAGYKKLAELLRPFAGM